VLYETNNSETLKLSGLGLDVKHLSIYSHPHSIIFLLFQEVVKGFYGRQRPSRPGYFEMHDCKILLHCFDRTGLNHVDILRDIIYHQTLFIMGGVKCLIKSKYL
jgi:hypothetical protein